MHPKLLESTVRQCRAHLEAGDCHGEAPPVERLIEAVVQLAAPQGEQPVAAGVPATADAQDAARYRWLRGCDLDAIRRGGVFAGMTPQNVVLNGDDLDRAVDDARGVQPSDEPQGESRG